MIEEPTRKLYTKHCAWCRAEFTTHRKDKRYHSNACRQAAFRRREISRWIIAHARDADRPVEGYDPDSTVKPSRPKQPAQPSRPVPPVGPSKPAQPWVDDKPPKGQGDQKPDAWPSWAGRRPDEYSPTREGHKF